MKRVLLLCMAMMLLFACACTGAKQAASVQEPPAEAPIEALIEAPAATATPEPVQTEPPLSPWQYDLEAHWRVQADGTEIERGTHVPDETGMRCAECAYLLHPQSAFRTGSVHPEETIIETEHYRICVEPGLYIPDDVAAYAEVVFEAMESVSGLHFFNESAFGSGKLQVNVEGPTEDNPACEYSVAYAFWDGVYISGGDLFIGNSNALTHELAHLMQYRQSHWDYCTVLMEGFAEYTCYRTLQELESRVSETGYALDSSMINPHNMDMMYEPFYAQSIAYWMENDFPFEYSGNGSYSVGFRLMAYLEDVYGDYSRWILQGEMDDPHSRTASDTNMPLAAQIAALQSAYGEDVLEGFYPWLKQHEDRFAVDYEASIPLDEYAALTIFPCFYYSGNSLSVTSVFPFRYRDLYIGLDAARDYLTHYKGRSVDNLCLNMSKATEVELFDAEGRSLGISTGKNISAREAAYFCLRGEGSGLTLDITGY